MPICFELDSGCCGCLIRSTVCTALCHYMVHGLFITYFVFSNETYPPLYHVDYVFGGCGAALFLISFLTAWCVDLKKFQFIRCAMALLTILTVLATLASTFYYAILRWDDVVVTAFSILIRSPALRDFPDELWYAATCIMCLETPIFLIYIVYIISFMFNPWKSFLFTAPYKNNRDFSALPPPRTIIPDTYSSRSYKPYPLQK